MSQLPPSLIPDSLELSRLFGNALGEKIEIGDRERQLLLLWEREVRSKCQDKVGSPVVEPHRWHLPDERHSLTHRFEFPTADGPPFKGYLTMGLYPDGQLGEVFLEVSREGAFASGIMDALATCISIALQHGVPLETFTRKFKHTNFEPSGMVVGAPREIQGFAHSVLDYLAKYLDLRFPDGILDPNALQKILDTPAPSPIR